MTTLKSIDEFLGAKRLAVVGVSRNPTDFTRLLFRELRTRGYDVVPVNPNVTEIEGIPTVAHVNDLSPAVEGALLLTKPPVTDEIVHECQEAGIQRIWIFRADRAPGSDSVEFCANHGIALVAGECPFMFLPHSGFPHNFHAFCKKLVGRYPN